jgi:hypothetical protein
MRSLYRWVLAFLGACLASYGGSAGLCSWAEDQATWPHWADFSCGHNSFYPWLVSVPVLTLLISIILGMYRRPR